MDTTAKTKGWMIDKLESLGVKVRGRKLSEKELTEMLAQMGVIQAKNKKEKRAKKVNAKQLDLEQSIKEHSK